jgi:hypothetical protein
MLLVLHRALSELKAAVEKALLSGSNEGRFGELGRVLADVQAVLQP